MSRIDGCSLFHAVGLATEKAWNQWALSYVECRAVRERLRASDAPAKFRHWSDYSLTCTPVLFYDRVHDDAEFVYDALLNQ